MQDGRPYRHHTIAVRGTPSNPMSASDVKAKALELIAPIQGQSAAKALIKAIWHLEDLTDIRELSKIARGEGV